MSGATSLLPLPASVALWSQLRGVDAAASLDRFGTVGNLAEALLWSRNEFGCDLMLAWSEIDRPAAEFAALLQRYRSAAKAG